jgi:hypothetical protein
MECEVDHTWARFSSGGGWSRHVRSTRHSPLWGNSARSCQAHDPPIWVGTRHLPCVADAPDGLQTPMLTITTAAVSTPSRPASPQGAATTFK